MCYYGYPTTAPSHSVLVYWACQLAFYCSLLVSQFKDIRRKVSTHPVDPPHRQEKHFASRGANIHKGGYGRCVYENVQILKQKFPDFRCIISWERC